MKSQIRKLPEVNFENNENASRFFALIKTEYLKNLYQTYFWLFLLVIIYVLYELILASFNPTIVIVIADQIFIAILFTLYLLIYFFNLSYFRFAPTIINFLEKELYLLGYKIKKKFKIRPSNFLFITFSIIVYLAAAIFIYFYSNYNVITLIMRLLIVYIFIGITIPVLRGKLHDLFVLYLRNSYFVQIELELKLIKHKDVESQMVKIFMTSNKLGSKGVQSEIALYNKISDKRWLQRVDKRRLPRLLDRKYLYFHEYATLINFKEQLLNIVSAIREWDIAKS